jgi:diadenosine tetraphosphate (Ap4A) HIT family hydrolase
MKYRDFLKNLNECPFCNLNKDIIFKRNSFAKVILAKAPYCKDHLLIIPNRHVLEISELTDDEKYAMFELVLWAQKKIKKRHKSLSILYREGGDSGKSIDHMHINIIPKEKISPTSQKAINRDIYSDSKYLKEISEFKARFIS